MNFTDVKHFRRQVQHFMQTITFTLELMLAIIVVYAILGLLCGFFSIYFTNKAKKKLETLEPTEENKQ